MRRISRRDLLGLGAAAGVVAVSGAPAHALPERGGSLRLGLAGRGHRRFDGRRPFDPIMRVVGHGAVFDCLTEIGADGAIRGELATGWEASADARAWTFRLREDAVFHDGRPFGADDVVATLRMHMGGSAAAVAGLIAQVRRMGPHEVLIVLREGTPGLPFLLSDPQLVMLPALGPERAMAEGIGTGLYRMEPGRTAERAVLRRVERHWKDGAAGWFDRVEVLRIAAPAARLEALKSGRVDAVNLADPAWEAEARRHGRIALTAVPGPAFLELAVEGAEDDRARGHRAGRRRAARRGSGACLGLRGTGARGGSGHGGGGRCGGGRAGRAGARAWRGGSAAGDRGGGLGRGASRRGGCAPVDHRACPARAADAGLAGDSAAGRGGRAAVPRHDDRPFDAAASRAADRRPLGHGLGSDRGTVVVLLTGLSTGKKQLSRAF